MADFAPNFTGRLKLRYSTLGHEHTMMWRFAASGSAVTASELAARMQAFLVAIQGGLYTDWDVVGMDYALANSDVFLPLTPIVGPAGAIALPTNPGTESAFSTCWLGRSIAGHRARFFVYGLALSPEAGGVGAVVDDWKVTTAENVAVSNGYASLAAGGGSQVANDNNGITWYNYIDIKYNDYWVRQGRL